MKKLLALLLALTLVLSMAACNTDTPAGTDPVETNPAGTNPATPAITDPTDPIETEPVVAEALPETPLLYWDFESIDGLTAMEQAKDDTGAITGLAESTHSILTADGVVGKALYLDGKYGVKLDMNNLDIADDSYTISFWIYAERLGDFMPIVQMGRNINSADETLPTAWINFTRGSWAETYPIAWNRNTSIPWATDENGVFPWIAGEADVVKGKNEWCLVTLVVDGNRYTCLDDNGDRIGTYYYLNGQLAFGAPAENLWYQGVSPELFTGSPVEGLIGINYWDSLYKGYIDELVIYDEALTAGQVLSLYEQGDISVVPVAPVETEADPEPTEPVLGEITPDANAIDALGTTARDLGWWTDNTAGYELKEGGTLTLKLNNYSNMGTNWNNFVLALTNTAVTTDLIAGADNYPGYAEYCVLRADAYGWGDASFVGAYEMSWTDWAAWLALMGDAEVTVVMTRNAETVVVDFTFTGADGTVMTEKATLTTSLTAEAPCYVHVGGEGAYIELLSVE